MKQRNDIEKRVEETLNSLDGIQQATPQPWLFSRIKRRLAEEEDRTLWGAIGGYLGKPVIAIAGLCFILMVNVFLVVNNQQKENTASFFSAQADQSVDSESLIASSSSFDYETLLQP